MNRKGPSGSQRKDDEGLTRALWRREAGPDQFPSIAPEVRAQARHRNSSSSRRGLPVSLLLPRMAGVDRGGDECSFRALRSSCG
jgi:hypothetical protein